ncbi:MAG: hypothetical protein QG656_947, partial [Candidatus Hydrogenedentes bacterium]|nr:hypothetical protein [Candidatus Hydrogenedentota bacterium]
VLGGSMPTPPDEVLRVLRPGGGVACLDTTVRRGPLEGAGMWTHQYADAANTASSGDTLTALPVRVQWFGEPGPRSMIDRHHRNIAPLSRDGRVFVPGDSLLFAIDAYNGTPLWQIELPDTRRMGAQRDASSHAVAEDLLYTPVGNACWALDVATGKRTAMFEAPQIVDGLALDWGYVATVDEGLFGSGRRHEARFTEISWQGDKEVQWGDYMRMVTSRSLFRMDRHSGEVQWTYTQGVIIQPTLTIGGGRVYFVESYSPKAIADEDGLIELATLFEQTPHLVALDERSGKPVYDCPVDLSVITHIVYQAYADEKLVITGSYNKNSRTWYQVFVFDAKTGSLLWTADHANNKEGLNGDHGEQVHHPVIAGGIIFAEPVAYNLQTGQRVNPGGQPAEWVMDGRGGCGTMSGSASYLYFRDGNPTMQSLDAQSVRTPLGQVSRPGCWINIIPACGIILVPEASAGCTCNFPIQTSIAFAPEARADK